MDKPSQVKIALEHEENEVKENFFQDIVTQIPDIWNIHAASSFASETFVIIFSRAPKWSRVYLKYHCWHRLYRENLNASTVRVGFLDIVHFFKFIDENFVITSIKDIDYSMFFTYIELLKQQIIKRLEEKKRDRSKRPTIGKILPKRAASVVCNIRYFFDNLALANIHNIDWIESINHTELFPEDINKYLSSEEKELYSDTILSLEDQKHGRAIPYFDLIKIMPIIYKCDNIYLKTVCIIAAHTGLRFIEILNLKINCMEPVQKEEINAVEKFIKLHKGGGAIIPDWSKSYWLHNYKVSKTREKPFSRKGTPILVSKIVYDAITEMINYTQSFREKSGKDYLFLIKRIGGKIGVASHIAINKHRRTLIKKNNLPYFSMHQFRHTFATILYDNGIPISYIKKYLNHINDDMTATYIASEKTRKLRAMELFVSKKVQLPMLNKHTQLVKTFNELNDSSEWASLAKEDQIELFELILKKHNVGFSYSDHGVCLLPEGEQCSYSLHGIVPCYLTGCKKYIASKNELEFFEKVLYSRKNHINQMEQINLLPDNNMALKRETKELEKIVWELNKS